MFIFNRKQKQTNRPLFFLAFLACLGLSRSSSSSSSSDSSLESDGSLCSGLLGASSSSSSFGTSSSCSGCCCGWLCSVWRNKSTCSLMNALRWDKSIPKSASNWRRTVAVVVVLRSELRRNSRRRPMSSDSETMDGSLPNQNQPFFECTSWVAAGNSP